MKERRISFKARDLTLEGILHLPSGGGPFPAVAVCHPHPLMGGDMHNQVVVSVCELLSRRGIAALRFNFRGVGGSEGRFARGEGEKEDLRGALHFLGEEELIDAEKLGVCGYSFGSMVAVPVGAESDEVKAIAAISPVVSLSPLRNCGKPKFFIWGERDAFINSSFLKREIEELPEPCDFKIIPPADHFWIGFERVVGEEVAEFFSRVLKSPRAEHN